MQTDREIAEMIAKFRTPPGMNWIDLTNDIETVLKTRPQTNDFQLMLARICNRFKKGLTLDDTIEKANDLLRRKVTLSVLR